MGTDPQLHIAVALDGAGWHPAAWRDRSAQPDVLFDASYWIDLVRIAERGALDFVTFEDALTLQSDHPFRSDERVDQVRGRLDASLLATRLAPVTEHIGLVPTVTTTHTEPFHVSTRIASLDFVSGGRAGWRVQVMKQREEVEHFGRRSIPDVTRDGPSAEIDARTRLLFDEATDSVEVVRRLWDSWEDDAEIRDASTGRFVDRDKVHYVDFEGQFFSVRGPSITPRSPQGQPVVVALAHATIPYELAASGADVVFVTPHDASEVTTIVSEVRDAEARVGRAGSPLRILADLVVFLDADPQSAADAKAKLDELNGAPMRSDAEIVTTNANGLADLLVEWEAAGVDGFRLRPGRLPVDLSAIAQDVAPELQRRGVFRSHYRDDTLRERLGLGEAVNRFAPEAPAGVGGRA